MKKCVLAYSGGLDTSAIIPWLKENYDTEVIAYCCDVGNLPPEAELRQRAMQLGAQEFYLEDARKEFVENYVHPMLQAGATYMQDYLLGTAIARPLIAEKSARFALKIGANFIAHGATGKGNDHIRFERTWSYIAPNLPIVAPWKLWNFHSREDLSNYLQTKGHSWGSAAKTFSVDLNLFHRSVEGGPLEQIGERTDLTGVLAWLKEPGLEASGNLTLSFIKGIPCALNGERIDACALLEALNTVGAKYGIGLSDIVEERLSGIKSRGVYETPGGFILYTALKALKQVCWSRDLLLHSTHMGHELGRLIYDGLWFTDSARALRSYFSSASECLTGEIELQLLPHTVRVVRRESTHSLYQRGLVSFEEDDALINKSALGYGIMLSLSSAVQGVRDSGQQ